MDDDIRYTGRKRRKQLFDNDSHLQLTPGNLLPFENIAKFASQWYSSGILGVALSNFFKKSLYRKAPPTLVRVTSIERVSPGLVAITFSGEGIQLFPEVCPAAHVKLFFPRDGQVEPVLPTLGPKGPVWPNSAAKPIVRTFSLRHCQPSRGEITVEFALHNCNGYASSFAKQAKVGDRLGVSYPGGPDPMLPVAEAYCFVGDMSAMPAIASLLEALPTDAIGSVHISLETPDNVRNLPRPSSVSLQYHFEDLGVVQKIVSAVEIDPLFRKTIESTYYWVAGEHHIVLSIRDFLKHKLQVGKGQIYALPYWKHNADEESYHDERDALMHNS